MTPLGIEIEKQRKNNTETKVGNASSVSQMGTFAKTPL
jgi:hypothetical protein